MAVISFGNGGGTNTTTSSTSNMDGQSMAALQKLIAELTNGGTTGTKQQAANQQSEINSNRASRAAYSKEAAFADAQGAMNAQLRKALEELLPGLTRSAEGAGTSQSSMRALLTQKAAQDAADSAATLGLNASTAYGGIASNFSSILANLVSQNDPTTTALLAALGVAKGAQTSSTVTTPVQGGGMIVPNYGSSGGSSSSSAPRIPAPNMSMSGTFGQSDTQSQLDSINKQLGIIGQLSGMGAYGPSTSLIDNNTF